MEPKPKTEHLVGDAPEINHDLLPGYTHSSNWKSPESFARNIRGKKEREAWHEAGWRVGSDGDDWSGTKNMQDALDLAENGWKKGAEDVENMKRRIDAVHPVSPRLVRHSVAGVTPNIARAVAGNPENMRVPDLTKSRKKPTITIVSNMSANCGVSGHAITNRAAAVCALIDRIESKGYSVEVISTATSRGGSWDGEVGFNSAVSIRLNESHQPVDIVRMAFGLGHSSMFRRFVFTEWGTHSSCKRGLGMGLGSHEEVHLKKDEDDDLRAVYKLPSAEHKSKYFANEELTVTCGLYYLIQSLKKQGCPAFAHVNVPDPEETFKEIQERKERRVREQEPAEESPLKRLKKRRRG